MLLYLPRRHHRQPHLLVQILLLMVLLTSRLYRLS
jgi:hypothetical protein